MTDKKILFVLPRMGGGGAERVVSLVANALAEHGNNVTILTLVGGDSFYPLDDKVNYHSLGVVVDRSSRLKLLWSEASFFGKSMFSIRKLIKKEKHDAVISFLVETDILVGLCKLTGLKFNHICSERNDPTKRSSMMIKLLSLIYKRAKLFVCQSKMVASFYKKVPDKIKRVIPNPINPEKLPERLTPVDGRIVAVGRLDYQKNFKMLINSIGEVVKDLPDVKLDIYGEGSLREELQSQIDSLKLENTVTLCGAKQNVIELISDAQLFVMSSDFEGFPNALLEAVAVGLPVISTNFPTGVAVELISEDNGIVVPTDDVQAMTDAVKKLLSDKAKLDEMGKASRKSAEKYYTPNVITMWEQEIEAVLNKN